MTSRLWRELTPLLPALRAAGFVVALGIVVAMAVVAARNVPAADVRWWLIVPALAAALVWWLLLARGWAVLLRGRDAATSRAGRARSRCATCPAASGRRPRASSRCPAGPSTGWPPSARRTSWRCARPCRSAAPRWPPRRPAAVAARRRRHRAARAGRRASVAAQPRRPSRSRRATATYVAAFAAYALFAVLVQTAVSGFEEPLAVAGSALVAWAAGLVVIITPGGVGTASGLRSPALGRPGGGRRRRGCHPDAHGDHRRRAPRPRRARASARGSRARPGRRSVTA